MFTSLPQAAVSMGQSNMRIAQSEEATIINNVESFARQDKAPNPSPFSAGP